MNEPQVIYVADLAKFLGITEAAVRGHIARESWPGAIPPPIRLGARLAWRLVDVDAWLEGKQTIPTKNETTIKNPVGRPHKTRTKRGF